MAWDVGTALSALELEWDRRVREDPLHAFVAYPKQRAFIDAVLSERYYENWFIASNRAGKSISGAYCGATWFRYGLKNPRPAIGAQTVVYDRATSGLVIGPDYMTLQHALLPKYFDNGLVPPGSAIEPFIPAREIARWDKQGQTLYGVNGSVIQAKSNEQSQVKFSAVAVDWEHFDEEPSYANYEEASLRVEAGQRLHIFGTCTLLPPPGDTGGVSWLYDKVIAPYLEGRLRDVGIFGASMYDNPHLLPEEITRLEAKYPPGSPQREIRIEGKWRPGIAGAVVYGNFDHRANVRELGVASTFLPILWLWDFNISPLISLVTQIVDGRMEVLRELVLEEGNIQGMVSLFIEEYPEHPQVWIDGDASGLGGSHQTGMGSYDLIMRGMQRYPGFVSLDVRPPNPREQSRIDSVNLALRDVDGSVRLVIAPQCEELLKDMLYVVYDRYGKIKKVNNRRDTYSWRTHASDALGYGIHRRMPVKSRLTQKRSVIPSSALRAPSYTGQRGSRHGR